MVVWSRNKSLKAANNQPSRQNYHLHHVRKSSNIQRNRSLLTAFLGCPEGAIEPTVDYDQTLYRAADLVDTLTQTWCEKKDSLNQLKEVWGTVVGDEMLASMSVPIGLTPMSCKIRVPSKVVEMEFKISPEREKAIIRNIQKVTAMPSIRKLCFVLEDDVTFFSHRNRGFEGGTKSKNGGARR